MVTKVHPAHSENRHPGLSINIVRAHFSKRGILKVCKAFLSRIFHAVVFTQFGYADSKSAPCQALFLVFPFQNCKNKMAVKIADKVSIIRIIHHV